MMHFADKYKPHNESLARFAEQFNAVGDPNLYFKDWHLENYRTDGVLVFDDDEIEQTIIKSFDWEKRHKHYDTYGQFPFRTLTQFGRKMNKSEIAISLQISADETGLLLAFHSDYNTKDCMYLDLETNKQNQGKEELYYTTHFKEFNIATPEGILELKETLRRAFYSWQFDHTVFVS